MSSLPPGLGRLVSPDEIIELREGAKPGFLILYYRKEGKRGTWNAAFIRAGRPITSAIRWSTITARNAWTNAGPAPTPVFTASTGEPASFGSFAAKRPKSAARRSVRKPDTWQIQLKSR
jgi:hypothetical protein